MKSKRKLANDEFLIIKKRCRYEDKIKSSKFIATAMPVDSEESADNFISEIKKEFHDATHNCTAWRIGSLSKPFFRFNDDGEPSGTAGKPILKAIESNELINICIVVTRYYGGTKLGTGGLMRAYGDTADKALKAGEIEKKHKTQNLTFTVSFDFTNVIHNIASNFKAKIKDTKYGDDVTFDIEIRGSKFSSFKDKLIEATNGQVKF